MENSLQDDLMKMIGLQTDWDIICKSRMTTVRRWLLAKFNLSVIHRADYQRILTEEAFRLRVNLRLGCDAQSVDFESPSVTLNTGEIIKGDVVVGADGGW